MKIKLSTIIIPIVVFLTSCSEKPNKYSRANILSTFDNEQGRVILNKSFESKLLKLLSKADQEFIPKLKTHQDGTLYYTYKRSIYGERLTENELLDLISKPHDYQHYRDYITFIFSKFRDKGVQTVLLIKKNDGAAARWIPSEAIIEINLGSLKEGTKNFAILLNHEAIHIAQSCKSGSINSPPKLIGLKSKLDSSHKAHLNSNVYRNLPSSDYKLEVEAYSNQSRLSLGPNLLDIYCE